MLIQKEPYREFPNEELLCYKGEKPSAPTPKKAESKTDKENAEALRKAVTEAEASTTESATIKTNLKKTRALIDSMHKKAKGYGSAADTLAQKLHERTNLRFSRINREYSKARAGEPSFEKARAAMAIEQKAENHFTLVANRIEGDKHEKYLSHQTWQDSMEQTRGEGKAPYSQKMDLIQHYLETKGIKPKMRKELARLILKSGKVKLEGVDLDAYSANNLEQFFKKVDEHSANVESAIEGSVKKVVEQFLAEAPKATAEPEEIDAVSTIILEDPKLNARFKGSPKRMKAAATAIAKRYDIQTKGGEIQFAADLTGGNIAVLEPKVFKKQIIAELKGPEFRSEDTIGDYSDNIDESTQWLTDLREEVGGINKLSKFANSTAVGKLRTKGANYKEWNVATRRNRRMESKTNKTAETRKKRETAWKKTTKAVETGITGGKAKEFTSVTSKRPNIGGKGTMTGKIKYTHTETNQQYTVDIKHKDGKALVTVEMSDGKEPPLPIKVGPVKPTELNHENLSQQLEKGRETYTTNEANFSKAKSAIAGIKFGKLAPIKLDEPSEKDLMSPDFKLPDTPLVYDGQQVGSIKFVEGGEVLVKIGTKEGKQMKPDKLNAYLTRYPGPREMQKTVKQSKANKKAVETQVSKDKGDIKPPDNLDFAPSTTLEGDFSQPEGLIQVGEFKKKADGNPAATLSVRTGKDKKDKARKYVLTVGEETTEFSSMEEVNIHLESNKVKLGKVAEKPKKPAKAEVEKKLTEAQKLAKTKLRELVRKKFGEKLGDAINDPRFDQALDTVVSGLTDKEAAQVESGEKLTKNGIKKILDAFIKAYGYEGLEEADDAEMKIIMDSDVIIKGADGQPTTEKFRKVFGEDLARSLSRSHEFQAGENGLEVKEGDAFVPVTAESMGKLVPSSLRTNYEGVIDGTTKPKDFQEAATKEAKAQELFDQMREKMSDPDAVKKAFGEMGYGEIIGSFVQLYKLFTAALESGDWQSLQDGLADFTSGDMMGRVDGAKEKYEKGIAGVKDTGDLISIYNEPYGKTAESIFGAGQDFGAGNKPQPYRIHLKGIIQERLEGDLEIDISEMKTISEKETKISCTKDSEVYTITLTRKGDKTFVKSTKREAKEDGTPVEKVHRKREEVQDTKSGDKNLAFVLFRTPGEAEEGAAEASEQAETPKGPQGVKPEFFEMKDGKMVLKGVQGATTTIQKILQPNVESITVQVFKDKHGVKKGKRVTAKKSGNTYMVNGERLRISDGDIVVGTTLKPEEENKPA